MARWTVDDLNVSKNYKGNKQVSIIWRDQKSLAANISLASFAVGYFHIVREYNNLSHILLDAVPKMPL